MSRIFRASFLFFAACDVAPCPNGDMVSSPAGLVVTASEHPEGWGKADCLACHSTPALHRYACQGDVDLAALRALVDEEGEESCMACHGDNGVDE